MISCLCPYCLRLINLKPKLQRPYLNRWCDELLSSLSGRIRSSENKRDKPFLMKSFHKRYSYLTGCRENNLHQTRAFCLLLALFFQAPASAGNDNRFTLVIDAGHGGSDPGAIQGKYREKDITLAVALKLGKLIENAYPDMKVIYTRKTDVAVDLWERGKIANKANAQLFISIHVNKFAKPTARGVETYVLGLHKSEASLEVAMRENEAIHYEKDYSVKYDGFDPKKAESYIMFNFMKNSFLTNSMALASGVQKQLVANTKMPDREVRQAGFVVLMNAGMPSILIETGFISNPSDRAILVSSSGQDKLAKSIFNAFKAYKDTMEKNSVVLSQASGAKEPASSADGKDYFYAVQVASSVKRITDFRYLKLREKVKELKGDGRYRYYVGVTKNYQQVLEFQRNVRKKIKDCFIIAVSNGKLIPVSEARKLEAKK